MGRVDDTRHKTLVCSKEGWHQVSYQWQLPTFDLTHGTANSAVNLNLLEASAVADQAVPALIQATYVRDRNSHLSEALYIPQSCPTCLLQCTYTVRNSASNIYQLLERVEYIEVIDNSDTTEMLTVRDTGTSAVSGFRYYYYEPTLGAAALFTVLFGVATILHLVQMLKTRTWFLTPFVIGGACK